MVLPSDNEVDDDLCDYLRQTNDTELQLDHDYLDSDVDYMFMWINNKVQNHIWPINAAEEGTNYDHYRG